MIDLDEIVLRTLEPNDADALYRFKNDWESTRSLGGFSYGMSSEDIRRWIAAHTNRAEEIFWSIAVKATNICIGHVALYNVDSRVRKAEFGILIGDRGWWNKGLGSRITAAVLAWGFEQANLHRIHLDVLATNQRAIAVYEKLGFCREGLLRDYEFRDGVFLDVIVMSLLCEEWRAVRSKRNL
ncbi:MAG: GNAT family protein [Terriglobales bacterium]|jgi:RimJ/RimL family protein N-acetyltransferase